MALPEASGVNAGIGRLVEAMSVLETSKVPLPAIFTGIDGPNDIESFFVAFERYCLVLIIRMICCHGCKCCLPF